MKENGLVAMIMNYLQAVVVIKSCVVGHGIFLPWTNVGNDSECSIFKEL